MNKLRIPENHSGVSKILRLPENIVDDIQSLANLKNLSFNRIVISLLEFGLNNLDEEDKQNGWHYRNQQYLNWTITAIKYYLKL